MAKSNGATFANAKKDFMRSVSARYDNDIEVISKRDTTIANRKAVYASIILFPKEYATPVKVCVIDGGDRFYLVSRTSHRDRSKFVIELERVQEMIFKTIVIQ